MGLLAGCRLNFDDTGAVADGRTGDGDGKSDGSQADAGPPPNQVFVTSTLHTADFGGIAGADAICKSRAEAGGLTGNFIALLGDSTTGVTDRLVGSRGWVDTIGQAIVDLPAGWFDGSMWHAVDHDELGNRVGYNNVWIGSIATYTCNDWTISSNGMSSSVVTTKTVFGAFTTSSCGGSVPIVCTEIGRDVPVAPQLVTGRKLFVSDVSWSPGSGRASADTLCANEASAAALTGTYLALMTTSSSSAWSRFSTTGPTWTRLDGVALGATAAEVAADPPGELASFANVGPTGHFPYATYWIGTRTSNCNDWSATSAGTMGRFGRGDYVDKVLWLNAYDAGCDSIGRLTCVEE